MQEWLHRAARELGLRVQIPYTMTLRNGETLVADAYFPDLSNPSGILVFESANEPDKEARHSLDAMGIGVSTFGAPAAQEQFDVNGYAEMFCEWGWTGRSEVKPPWMP